MKGWVLNSTKGVVIDVEGDGLDSSVHALAAGTVRVLRDPTRRGLATTLNEIANQPGVAITVVEEAIPIRDAVRAACEMLGYDPLYIANEGKLVAVCPPEAVPAQCSPRGARRHMERRR